MKQRFNLAEWAIHQRSLVFFFMIVMLAAGAWSYTRLGRSEDPPFTTKFMVVQASWPGATLPDTVQQITDRVEKKLQETPGLDYIRSYTTPGEVTIEVVIKDTLPARNVPDMWYQVRKKADDIGRALPDGFVVPHFNDELVDTFALVYGFTADGFTHRELRDFVEGVRSRLLSIKDVNKIDVIGTQDERLYLEFPVQQTSGAIVDRNELIKALQSQNAVTPAGVVRTGGENIHLRVSGGFASEQDLRRINFVFNGRLFRMGDIGAVKRSYADPPQPMFRVNGQDAIALAISMRDGGDVLALGRNIRNAIAAITGELPVGIESHLVADQPTVVSHAVNDFMRSLGEALVIVLAISFLSLGLRAGAVVALSIPLVLAIVFVFMDVNKIALQRVSLGALIISLGLLVDDAMITVEMMIRKLEEGWDRTKAATYAYTTTHFPMGTGTLVTVVAFLPIGLAQSAAGEYLVSLFAVVAVALIVSWFVAAIFTPLIGWVLLSDKLKRGAGPAQGRITRRFRELVVLSMRWRRVTVSATFAAFVLSIVGLAFLHQQFFPASDRTELLVDLRLPQNASIVATRAAAVGLDRLLREDSDVERWSTYVGQGAVRFYLSMLVHLPQSFLAQAVVVTKSLEARERVKARLEKALQDDFPELVARVYPLEMGMPVGWPVQYRVSGPEPDKVREIAYRVASVMAENPQLRDVNFDWMETAKTLQIRVDQEQARLLNISSSSVAQALNTVITGTNVTQVRDGIYLIDVIIRAEEKERISLAGLGTLQIPLPNGRSVPLVQVASVGYGQELPLIRRRDRVPTLTVQADVLPGVQPETAAGAVQSKIAALGATLPAGYGIVRGGIVEESAKSQNSLAAVMPLMLILLLTVVIIQVRSFRACSWCSAWRPSGHRRRPCAARLRQAARLRGAGSA